MDLGGGFAWGVFGDLETIWSRREYVKNAVLTAYGTWMLVAPSYLTSFDRDQFLH